MITCWLFFVEKKLLQFEEKREKNKKNISSKKKIKKIFQKNISFVNIKKISTQ